MIMAHTAQGLTGILIICRHSKKARKAAEVAEEKVLHPMVAVLVPFFIYWLLLFCFML